MKKIPLLSSFLVLGIFSINAQVGVNTNVAPLANLEVKLSANNSQPDGVIVTKVTVAQLNTKSPAYTVNQKGAMVFVDDVPANFPGSQTITSEIKAVGFYYYDGVDKFLPVAPVARDSTIPIIHDAETNTFTADVTTTPIGSNYVEITVTGGGTLPANTTLVMPPANTPSLVGRSLYFKNNTNGVVKFDVAGVFNGNWSSSSSVLLHSNGARWILVSGRF